VSRVKAKEVDSNNTFEEKFTKVLSELIAKMEQNPGPGQKLPGLSSQSSVNSYNTIFGSGHGLRQSKFCTEHNDLEVAANSTERQRSKHYASPCIYYI